MIDDGQRVDSTGYLETGPSFDALDIVTLGYTNGARGDFTCSSTNNGLLFDRGLISASEILADAVLVRGTDSVHSGYHCGVHTFSSVILDIEKVYFKRRRA